MAQRRMFSLTIVDTDRFLEMPSSAQALYFHLGMRADDEGFVSSPRKITALAGCAADDLKLLAAKGFVIPFKSGICVITDWRQNNYIQSDRFKPTVYSEEKASLSTDKSGSYTSCIQNVYSLDTQVRLGKDSIGKAIEANASCAEPPPDVDTPRRNAVITLTLNDKSEYPIFEEQTQEWAALYPAVDVIQQLRNMRGWLDANPARRKTKGGILKFINGWLSREQNKGGYSSASPKNGQTLSAAKNYDENF